MPSMTTSSTRWSWDPEDERKRQEKWQKEQERLLQVNILPDDLQYTSKGMTYVLQFNILIV